MRGLDKISCHGVIAGEQLAARRPDAGIRNFADFGEALQCVVYRTLGAGDAKQIVQVQGVLAVSVFQIGQVIQIGLLIFAIGRERVERKTALAVLAGPDSQNLVFRYLVDDRCARRQEYSWPFASVKDERSAERERFSLRQVVPSSIDDANESIEGPRAIPP